MRRSLEDAVRRVYAVLESLGYRPIVVGTYALILQGWLPPWYLEETKDVDIYVDEPMIVFDDRVEERMLAIGLSVGRTESGGFYIDAGKPVEIVYPIHDFFIPRALLRHTVSVKELKVLEGHAALVAKAMGSSIDHLAPMIKAKGVRVDVERLHSLLRSIAGEVDPSRFIVVKRRVESFIGRMVLVEEEEVVSNEA